MGGFCEQDISPQVSASEELTETKIPEWVSRGGQELWEQARLLAQNELPTYGGPRVAGLNELQQQGVNLAAQNVGIHQPYTQAATDLTGMGSRSFTDPGVSAQYYNPFQTEVTERAAEELSRDFASQQLQAKAKASTAGAWGGTRHALLESEVGRNQAQALGDLRLKGRQAGYESAFDKFSKESARQLGAGAQYGQLGQLAAGLGSGDVAALQAAGGLQQQDLQKSYDVSYQDWLEQRDDPYKKVNWATGVLQGVPYETSTSRTGTRDQFFQGPSVLGQVGGALGALYGGYRLFGGQKVA
jgi:hypothetical protein